MAKSQVVISYVVTLSMWLLASSSNISAQVTEATVTGTWNTFLRQINIVECSATSSDSAIISLQLRSDSGRLLTSTQRAVAGFGTTHIVISGLNGVGNDDQYGTYVATASSPIYCHTVVYRLSRPGSPKPVEYAYSLPSVSPVTGRSYGLFNSMNPEGGSTSVNNWLSITNLGDNSSSSVITVFDVSGVELARFSTGSLQPKERRDFPIGHDRGQVLGMYSITPAGTEPYSAQTIRYGVRGAGYIFAFPLQVLQPSCDSGPVPVSTMASQLNWGEVANVNDDVRHFSAELRDQTGALIRAEEFLLQPFQQRHFPLHLWLGANNLGSFRLRCVGNEGGGVLAQSLFYGRPDGVTQSVEWAYASQATGRQIDVNQQIAIPINTFFAARNWNKFHNHNNVATSLSARIFDAQGQLLGQAERTLASDGSIDYPFHLHLDADHIGLAIAEATNADALFSSELLRVIYRSDGGIGYIFNLAGEVLNPLTHGDGSSSVNSSSVNSSSSSVLHSASSGSSVSSPGPVSSQSSSSSVPSSANSSGSSSSEAPPPPPPPLSQTPCSGLESQHVYPVSTLRDGQVCPSSTSRVYYISAVSGSDSNSGLSTSAPLLTLDRAMELAESYRNGSVWMLLKRGEVWSGNDAQHNHRMDRTKYVRPFGPSAANPTVISAWGSDLHSRPVLSFMPDIQGSRTVHGLYMREGYNVTISGIQVQKEQYGTGGVGIWVQDFLNPGGRYASQYPITPTSGIYEVVASTNIVVEDSAILGFGTNLIFQGLPTEFGWNEFDPAAYPGLTPHVVFNGRSYIACHRQPLSVTEQQICNRDNDMLGGQPYLCQNDPTNDLCDFELSGKYTLDGIKIERNLIAFASPPHRPLDPSHSQGLYTSGVQGVSLQGNIIYKNGWQLDRNGAAPGSEAATIFNHNLYFQYGYSGPVTIRNNIIAEGSSHGMQARSGATVEANLFVRNPLGFFLGQSSLGRYLDYRNTARYNVVTEGNDINSSFDRGMAIEHNRARRALYSDNIIAHMAENGGPGNNIGMLVSCEPDAVNGQIPERLYPCQLEFSDNIIHNWSNQLGGGALLQIAPNQVRVAADDTLLFARNIFSEFNPDQFSMVQLRDVASGRVAFSQNSYRHSSLPGSSPLVRFDVPNPSLSYPQSINFPQILGYPQWQNQLEPSATAQPSSGFPQPCRSIGTYYSEQILNQSARSCSEMFDDALFDAFMARAMQRSRFRDNTDTDATTVINYIREGFGKPPIPPL